MKKKPLPIGTIYCSCNIQTDNDRFNLFKVFYAWYCQFQYNAIHFAMKYELNIIILLFDIFQIIYNINHHICCRTTKFSQHIKKNFICAIWCFF